MEEINQLTGAGRDLKKLVKRTEKSEVYESDEEEGNPYASVYYKSCPFFILSSDYLLGGRRGRTAPSTHTRWTSCYEPTTTISAC